MCHVDELEIAFLIARHCGIPACQPTSFGSADERKALFEQECEFHLHMGYRRTFTTTVHPPHQQLLGLELALLVARPPFKGSHHGTMTKLVPALYCHTNPSLPSLRRRRGQFSRGWLLYRRMNKTRVVTSPICK